MTSEVSVRSEWTIWPSRGSVAWREQHACEDETGALGVPRTLESIEASHSPAEILPRVAGRFLGDGLRLIL